MAIFSILPEADHWQLGFSVSLFLLCICRMLLLFSTLPGGCWWFSTLVRYNNEAVDFGAWFGAAWIPLTCRRLFFSGDADRDA